MLNIRFGSFNLGLVILHSGGRDLSVNLAGIRQRLALAYLSVDGTEAMTLSVLRRITTLSLQGTTGSRGRLSIPERWQIFITHTQQPF